MVVLEVLLEFQKAYDALDWDRYLDIIAAYGVSPRYLWLLWAYWGKITMVDRAGGYYPPSLQGLTWSYPVIPPLPPAFKCGCKHRHHPLGDGGGSNRGGHRGNWNVDTGLGGIFLCQRWTRYLEPTVEASEGVWRPHRPLQPGHSQDEYAEDSEYGLLDMRRAC